MTQELAKQVKAHQDVIVSPVNSYTDKTDRIQIVLTLFWKKLS